MRSVPRFRVLNYFQLGELPAVYSLSYVPFPAFFGNRGRIPHADHVSLIRPSASAWAGVFRPRGRIWAGKCADGCLSGAGNLNGWEIWTGGKRAGPFDKCELSMMAVYILFLVLFYLVRLVYGEFWNAIVKFRCKYFYWFVNKKGGSPVLYSISED